MCARGAQALPRARPRGPRPRLPRRGARSCARRGGADGQRGGSTAGAAAGAGQGCPLRARLCIQAPRSDGWLGSAWVSSEHRIGTARQISNQVPFHRPSLTEKPTFKSVKENALVTLHRNFPFFLVKEYPGKGDGITVSPLFLSFA